MIVGVSAVGGAGRGQGVRRFEGRSALPVDDSPVVVVDVVVAAPADEDEVFDVGSP